jgi:hypothetical protein
MPPACPAAGGVETPQDKGVKDGSSIHVLKDVAISSALSDVLKDVAISTNTFWILRFAQNDDGITLS